MIAASNRKALDACHIGPGKSVQIEDSVVDLSFGGLAPFSIEAHFYIEPCAEPILPPGHQQGPAQWHGHQVLVSKFNGCVSGEYRLGLDSQRRVIFQREVDPWIVTTQESIPPHEWHSVVATYDGRTMRIYVDSRLSAHVACGAQKADTVSPVVLGADLCGYATAHHFEGYLSEVSIWGRCLDAQDIRLLAQHGPTGHTTLQRDLMAYWCMYQRTETPGAQGKGAGSMAIVHNSCKGPNAGGQGALRYRGRVVSEGEWAIGRYRQWLYSGCTAEAMDWDDGGLAPPPDPQPPAPPAPSREGEAGRTTGVLFSASAKSHLHICGSASSLSFGELLPYTLAVQFYPSRTGGDGAHASGGGGGAHATRGDTAARDANGTHTSGGDGGGEQILISKFNRGLRGEYRLGLDATGRPFVGREANPWILVAPDPVESHSWHSCAATFDGHTLRLFVDYKEVASAPSGPQFSDQVTPVLLGCDLERDTYAHYFEGFVAEACIWGRALAPKEVELLATSAPHQGTPMHRSLLGCWRLLESKQLRLHAAGRVVVPNAAFDPWAPRHSGAQPPSHAGHAHPGAGNAGVDNSAGTVPAHAPTHAVLRTSSHTHTLGITMRAGVQAIALELGAVGHDLSRHWVQAVQRLGTHSARLRAQDKAMAGAQGPARAGSTSRLGGVVASRGRASSVPSARRSSGSGGGGQRQHVLAQNGHPPATLDMERRYCYVGMSVALQKNMTQALDLHANEVLVHRLQALPMAEDASLQRLHSEYKQKLVDVRGRAWALFRDWFFDNPVHALRECDGDRCEFWRFKYPVRRVRACQVLAEEATRLFPPKAHCPLVVASFGSGLLFQDFCTMQMLLDAGFRHIRLCLVDTAYRPWKAKYLQRDSSCRAYVVPSSLLDAQLLRPDPVNPGPTDTDETINNATATACNNAISFVLYNDALHQFIQWFACVPDAEVQIVLYDSVDAYIQDCQMAPEEMACHVCSAMDYKDNETLLEDAVNHMMTNCLAWNGIGVKLVTKPNETLPGVYVVDRQLRELYHEQLPLG